MAEIHKTAIVSDETTLADDVIVGPFTIIEGPVKIGKGTKIASNVLISGDTRIGENCSIHHGAVIGTDPQDLKFGGEKTIVEIGNNVILREYVMYICMTMPSLVG
jgi:UDP-N-acetylglucosamine acyltransferase